MILKVEYKNEKERTTLLSIHSDLILIEEQNITEGNFLIFSDTIPEKEVIYTNVPEGKIEEMELKMEEKDRENKNALFEIYNMLGGA